MSKVVSARWCLETKGGSHHALVHSSHTVVGVECQYFIWPNAPGKKDMGGAEGDELRQLDKE
jgi:hypothetical protein